MCYRHVYQFARKMVQRAMSGLAALTLIISTGGTLPLIFTQRVFAAGSTVTVCANGCNYTNAQSAVDTANPGDTIELNSDLSISSQITIAKPLTLDGNGHTISPTFAYTGDNANNSSIGIDGTQDVTISNLIINGTAGTGLHGINIYESTGINLSNVTSKNNDKDGIVVNGSAVTVESLSTSNNGWGGVDVDQGSGVTNPASLTVHASSYQEEIAAIIVDNVTKAVSVTDTDSQYTHVDSGNLRIYTQIPTGIANQSPTNGAYTTTAGLTTIAWHAATSPHGPLSYYYESSHSSDVKADGSFTTPAYGPVSTGANAYTPASNTPEGVWYWHARAKDSLGNYSSWTAPWKITVDNTAPSVPSITSPTNGQYFNHTPITDSWTASIDNLSGVDYYQVAYLYDDGHTFGGSTCPGVQIGGKSVSGCRDTAATSRDHVPGTGEQGGVTIWVRAFDKSDNASAWSSPVHYYYDATPPAVPSAVMKDANGHQVQSNGYIATKSFTFSLSSSADVTQYQLKYWNSIPGDPFNGEAHAWNPTNLSTTGHMNTLGLYIDQFTRGEGTHYFEFSACDAAGNCSAYSTPFVVTYDATAPATFRLTGPTPMDNAFENSTNFNFTWEASSDASGVTYKICRSQLTPAAGVVRCDWGWTVRQSDIDKNGTQFPFNSTYIGKNGNYTWYWQVSATDAAGNTTLSNIGKVTIDQTAPAITDNFTVNMLTGDKVTLSPTVADSSPVTYKWSVSDDKLLNNPKDTRDGSSLAIGPAPKGSYTVTLTVTDAAGNKNTVQYAVTISTPAQNTPPANHFSAPQTLGASASNTSNNTTSADTESAPTNDNGHVKGDSTTVVATDTTPQADLNSKNTSGFLVLGWWWLVVLAALFAFFMLAVFHRGGTTDRRS